MLISANLGMLFTDLPLLSAVRAAASAGFDAIEVHFPYAVPAGDLRAVLTQVGVPLVSLNTAPGDLAAGEFGLAAVPGRAAAARAAVDQAVAYAAVVGARAVHVMAGKAQGAAAGAAFAETLAYACDAVPAGMDVLIEPINPFDVPGYFLGGLDQAARVLDDLGRDNLRILFDCYHVARIHGDVAGAFAAHRDRIGHVQFAAVPDRGEPDRGDIDYARLLPALGWDGAFGAEYRPRSGNTGAGLAWMAGLRAAFSADAITYRQGRADPV